MCLIKTNKILFNKSSMCLIENYKRVFVIVGLSLLLISCSDQAGKDSQEAAASSKEEQAGESALLVLTPEQMKNVGIDTGRIGQQNLEAVVKANGQLAVPPQNKADVSILSGGIISHINVIEGQEVRQGQMLATINNQDLVKIQQDYLTAKNNFSYIEAEFNRQTQLKAAGAGTGKSFQAAEATFHAERARLTGYETQLKQLGIALRNVSNGHLVSQFPVLSPINGTVGQISANTGAFVQPGTSIMEVVDNSKIHCDLTVFEKDLMQVRIGQKVTFQLTNQENQLITGRINGINKSFENESKGVIVHAVINNSQHKNLIPGMYVTALISTGSRQAPAVPVEAIVRSEGKHFLFIVDEENKNNDGVAFKKVEVTTGVSALGYVEITPIQALRTDARVALKGAFYLESMGSGAAGED
jgi:cobalt-zinc-cadmium efflux system membrane fusion protein